MNTAGLSLEQAPPFGGIYPFFILSGLFGMAAGGVLVLAPADGGGYFLAVLHLVTLGVMGNAMTGALFQMVPVMIGVPLPSASLLRLAYGSALNLGTLCLSIAFLQGSPSLFATAGALLLVSVVLFAATVLFPVLLKRGAGQTGAAMRIAAAMFVAAALIGITIVFAMGGVVTVSIPAFAFDLHPAVMLFGWVALLVMGVSYQVIPMFYVAKGYPRYILMLTVPFMIAGMFASTFSTASSGIASALLLGMPVIAWGYLTAKRLSGRSRPIADATLALWYLGLLLVSLGSLALILGRIFDLEHGPAGIAALAALLSGYTAIMIGMMNKIVPFLVWFHLTSRGRYDSPSMRRMIPAEDLTRQGYLHALTAVSCVLAGWYGYAAVAGVAMIVSFGYVVYNLSRPIHLYIRMVTPREHP